MTTLDERQEQAQYRDVMQGRERALALLRRPSTLGTLLLIVLLVCSAFVWARSHPSAWPDARGKVTAHGFADVGQPVTVAMTAYRLHNESAAGATEGTSDPIGVTLTSVQPRVSENSAGATFDFAVCRLSGKTPLEGLRSAADVASLCTRLDPISGAGFVIGGESNDQIVMTVIADQPGTVHVEGIDITASRGWRTGTEHTGENALLTFG